MRNNWNNNENEKKDETVMMDAKTDGIKRNGKNIYKHLFHALYSLCPTITDS